MQFKYYSAILLAAFLLIISGCQHDHPHNPDGSHPHENDGHGHAHAPDGSHITPELQPLAFTKWTAKSELFVEFKPLIVGKESRFAAHFSDMLSFKAVEAGKLRLLLMNNGKVTQESSVDAPSSPGIFRPGLTPKKAGAYQLQFILESPTFSDTIRLPGIKVYSNTSTAFADNPAAEEGDEITYLKEQAWKTEFAIEQVKRRSINDVIHTSGEIQPVKGKEKIVAAKSSGIVLYKNPKLQEGRTINKGEVLFTISSQSLIASNAEEKYRVAKARLDKAKANFERAEGLLAQQIIGKKEFENRKMELTIAEAEWQTFTTSNQGKGQSITAPMSGIIKNLMISDGEFAEEGKPLIEITNIHRLMLHAEVAQQYLPQLSQITSANFKAPYQNEVQSLEDYRGKLVTVGKVLESGKHFLPIWFELDNVNELIPGSFVELFLLTKAIDNQLVISKSALMQDYNKNYVFVQTAGESFEKRTVQLGIDDGKNVQVLSGVSEGEWVVTKGAYQIKMASMSSTIPSHGHAH